MPQSLYTMFNERRNQMTNATSHRIAPTEGERADLPGLGNRYILRSEHTGGRFALVEHTIAPRALAAPVHTHRDEDEYSYVLSGRMGAIVGDEVIEAGPGELVVKPRNSARVLERQRRRDPRARADLARRLRAVLRRPRP